MMRSRTIIKPNGSILLNERACLYGRRPVRTLPPSRGGIGIILKAARMALIMTLDLNIIAKGFITVVLRASGDISARGIRTNLRSNTLIRDSSIFVIGPAAAEMAMSLLGFLKFIGFMGTGLAYPKTNWPFVNIMNIRGIRIVPIGSIWAIGFNVSLPMILAVGSPNLYATKP